MAILTITGASSSGGYWVAEIEYSTTYNSTNDTSNLYFTAFRIHKGSATATASTTSARWYLIVNSSSIDLGTISYTVPAYGAWGNWVNIYSEIANQTPGIGISISLDDPWNNLYLSNNSARFATAYAASRTVYTVSYNANGGSGTVASQTKYQDVFLTLRNGGYWRAGYILLGWSETSSATTPTWYVDTQDAQALRYSYNRSATLYAIWKPFVNMVYAKSGSSWVTPAIKIKVNNTWIPCTKVNIIE